MIAQPISGSLGVNITGNQAQGQTLTASCNVDGVCAFQWLRNGADVSGATGSTYLLTQADVGTNISVRIVSITSNATGAIANVNDLPTGTVTITGTVANGQTLTASNTLADIDGMGTVTYQWYSDNVIISGATAATYLLTASDVGKVIKVVANYTDALGTAESVASANTAPVEDAVIFTPLSLFASGEEGIWFDVSDFGRYMGDLGPELISNRTFDSGINGWVKGTGTTDPLSWDSVGQRLKLTNDLAYYASAFFYIPTVVGRIYKVSGTITTTTVPARLQAQLILNSIDVPINTTQYVEFTFTATTTTQGVGIGHANLTLGAISYLDNISVRELTSISTATLFQDSAGTTPVTAVEQPVGLVLEKSKGLVLGPELFAFGDGATTGWTATSASITTIAGRLRLTSTSTYGKIYTISGITTQVGKSYRLQFEYITKNDAFLVFRVGTFATGLDIVAGSFSTVGLKQIVFTAKSSATFLFFENASITEGFNEIDNISLKELPGNHATQTISTARPTLRARYNLLTYSEDFSNAAWQVSGITATASLIKASTVTTTHRIGQTIGNVVAASPITFKVNLKMSGARYWRVGLFGGSLVAPTTGSYVDFDLQAGTIVTNATSWGAFLGQSASIVSDGVGGFNCTLTTTPSVTTVFAVIAGLSAPNVESYAGDGTSGVTVTKASVTTAQYAALPYQRITSATSYDADLAKFPPYLHFDGVDDYMAVANLALSGNNVSFIDASMPLSFTNNKFIYEFSNSILVNKGFARLSPFGEGLAGISVNFGGAGFSPTEHQYSKSNPLTDIVSVIVNNTTMSSRKNGVSMATSSIINNLLNTANLYIGVRTGSNYYFNGNLYGLVIINKAITTQNVVDTENYLAAKAGITL